MSYFILTNMTVCHIILFTGTPENIREMKVMISISAKVKDRIAACFVEGTVG